jgi:hypothetical protein
MAPKVWFVAAVAAIGIGTGIAAANDVNVGVNTGVPGPPPFVVTAPPTVIIIPGTTVYRIPSASFNLFVFGGRYYSFHNDAWFLSASYSGPWKMIAVQQVPKPVLGVPVTYYKIPPGQAKKMGLAAVPPGQAKGHKDKQ